jgi:hypothetical protein
MFSDELCVNRSEYFPARDIVVDIESLPSDQLGVQNH